MTIMIFFYFSWVEMHQIIKEPPCPLFAAVRHNSQTMDHTSKVQERRDEDQGKHHLHQFKDRQDLHLCVQECHLHLHHQSQIHLEVGVRVIIKLPHHRHQGAEGEGLLFPHNLDRITAKRWGQIGNRQRVLGFFCDLQTKEKSPC